MKSYGGLFHTFTSVILRVVLWGAYLCLKVRFFNKETGVGPDNSSVEPIPEKPISSLSLATALDSKSPVKKLIGLVDDESYIVRRALVRNPSLPKESLEKLREDPDNRVRLEVEQHYPSKVT